MSQAGWRTPEQRVLFYAFHIILPVMLILLVFAGVAISGGSTKPPIMLFLYLFIAAAFGFLVPRWILRHYAASRRERLRAELPLLLNLLIMMFEAGLSTRQTFASIVREGGGVLPVLGSDFAIIVNQLEAGGDLASALDSYAKAMSIPELTSVLGVLKQVDRYGGEIREPLQEALEVIAERRSLEIREKVNEMSGRMTVAMVFFFFPSLLIFVAAPAFIAIINVLSNINAK